MLVSLKIMQRNVPSLHRCKNWIRGEASINTNLPWFKKRSLTKLSELLDAQKKIRESQNLHSKKTYKSQKHNSQKKSSETSPQQRKTTCFFLSFTSIFCWKKKKKKTSPRSWSAPPPQPPWRQTSHHRESPQFWQWGEAMQWIDAGLLL